MAARPSSAKRRATKDAARQHPPQTATVAAPVSVQVAISRLPHGMDLPLPAYQSAAAAGLDLIAALSDAAPVTLAPGARTLVPTGLAMALPPGFEAQIRPRSGLALKHGITVLNSPGTIDADYRGEVQVILVNLGDAPFVIRRGERIAQMVIASVTQATLVETANLDATARGTGGFGSTGLAPAPSLPAAMRSRPASKKVAQSQRGPATRKPSQKSKR